MLSSNILTRSIVWWIENGWFKFKKVLFDANINMENHNNEKRQKQLESERNK